MNNYRGFFITFEGCEGCGKSTQSRLLHKKLASLKIPSMLTQEPGGTPLGNKVRELLKVRQDISISPMAELMLFNGCRTQLIQDVIRPALAAGKTVICDRFTDSTLVYQGYGRGLDLKTISSINMMATGGLVPGLTVLLDTDPAQGLRRKHNSSEDRFETEDLAFHRRIRDGYLELAASEPSRWLIVKHGQTIDEIANVIWKKVSPSLIKHYPEKEIPL